MFLKARTVAAFLSALTLGCGGEAACVPGEQVECACPGNRTGAQACNGDGTGFGECSCDGSPVQIGGGDQGGSSAAGDACQVAADQFAQDIETKFDECDIEQPEPSGGANEGGASPCTAEKLALLQCNKQCSDEHVTCGVLAGEDLDGINAYLDCVDPCLPED
jgi:hypothetical protein